VMGRFLEDWNGALPQAPLARMNVAGLLAPPPAMGVACPTPFGFPRDTKGSKPPWNPLGTPTVELGATAQERRGSPLEHAPT